MEQVGDEISIYCNVCAGERDHEVLFSVERRWDEEPDDETSYGYLEVEQCLVAACCGCKHRTFLTRWWNGPEKAITQYPPKTVRRKPHWSVNLFFSNIADPTKIELLDEIYAALGAECLRLAVMGIRALLEHIMIEQVGDEGGFDEKLNAFEKKGCISTVQRAALAPIIQAGHASMHRAYKPPLDDVMFCLDVVENVIASIYVHPNRSIQMKVPQRPPRRKKSAVAKETSVGLPPKQSAA
jgi:hypothetical protein